ncbi:MAG: TatD family hydrolase [Myxococcales bacterium]|nr:TatD family hydrolase [Myxococcales bacterium]
MIDAHCHLDFEAFDADRATVVARAKAAGVEAVVIPGVSPAQWRRAAALRIEGVSALVAVGWHPEYLASASDVPEAADEAADEAALTDAATRFGAAAIGECGLDRRVEDRFPLSRQREVFEAHVRVARALALPLVLHVVRRDRAALDLLAPFAPLRGMVHGFVGAPEVAREYLALGLHLSFGGGVTRPGARRARASAPIVPDDRLLVETDAPDQAPWGAPSERNEPAFLGRIVAELARLRGTSEDAVAKQTAANARALFGTGGSLGPPRRA